MKKEVFTEYEAEKFLKKYLPVAESKLIKNKKELKFKKFPLVLKIISKDALHKTEISGVLIANNKKELKNSYNKLIKLSKKLRLKLDGILIQEFVKGIELIIGIKKDETFGHAIMFGLGGIFVEVLKDVSFRICPINEKDAESMIQELKTKEILFGTRNQKPVDLKLLKKILVKTSKIPLKHKNIKELDINPLINGKVVDARIIF